MWEKTFTVEAQREVYFGLANAKPVAGVADDGFSPPVRPQRGRLQKSVAKSIPVLTSGFL